MSRSKPWLTALLQLLILLLVVVCAAPWLDAKERSLPTPRRANDVALPGSRSRPVFNGSVVPGGVYTLDEVRAAIERDPVVAAHYRAVDLDEMQLVTLTEGKAAYVSYRVGDRVYWTRNRVYLKAGETVLTDGHTTIRARCGNCVSDVKQHAAAAVEPAHGELDDFVVPPTPETGVDAFAADAEQRLGDLFDVPFGPQVFATLGPSLFPTQGPTDDAFSKGGSPVFIGPPLGLPGGGGGTGGGPPGALPGGGGAGGGLPPGPPGVFVPGDGGTGSSGDVNGSGGETGSTTGDVTTGTPTDDLIGGASTGGLTGTSGTSTNGAVTDGTEFPTTTTASGSTSSTGVTSAPEPEVLWLAAAGLIGVARRHLRKP